MSYLRINPSQEWKFLNENLGFVIASETIYRRANVFMPVCFFVTEKSKFMSFLPHIEKLYAADNGSICHSDEKDDIIYWDWKR